MKVFKVTLLVLLQQVFFMESESKAHHLRRSHHRRDQLRRPHTRTAGASADHHHRKTAHMPHHKFYRVHPNQFRNYFPRLHYKMETKMNYFENMSILFPNNTIPDDMLPTPPVSIKPIYAASEETKQHIEYKLVSDDSIFGCCLKALAELAKNANELQHTFYLLGGDNPKNIKNFLKGLSRIIHTIRSLLSFCENGDTLQVNPECVKQFLIHFFGFLIPEVFDIIPFLLLNDEGKDKLNREEWYDALVSSLLINADITMCALKVFF